MSTRTHHDIPLEPGDEPPVGAHLVTPRTFYTHHGIYAGGGIVIHYAGFACGLRRGPVEQVSLERFAHGAPIRIRPDARRFDSRTVVERARSRLGECRYRLLTNNCEHFCAWALRDECVSLQMERLRHIPQAIYTAIAGFVRDAADRAPAPGLARRSTAP
jgi:hypothetical protein